MNILFGAIEFGSLADWVSAATSLLVIVAIFQTNKANRLLRDQVNAELNPQPKLEFAVVSHEAQGETIENQNLFELIVVNYGNSPAILTNQTTKHSKESGMRILQPTIKGEQSVNGALIVTHYFPKSTIISGKAEKIALINAENLNETDRYLFVFSDKSTNNKSYFVNIGKDRDGYLTSKSSEKNTSDISNLTNDRDY